MENIPLVNNFTKEATKSGNKLKKFQEADEKCSI